MISPFGSSQWALNESIIGSWCVLSLDSLNGGGTLCTRVLFTRRPVSALLKREVKIDRMLDMFSDLV